MPRQPGGDPRSRVEFFTSPYSFDMVDHIDKYVCAYKIGSGDITWHDIIKYIAKKNKPKGFVKGKLLGLSKLQLCTS